MSDKSLSDRTAPEPPDRTETKRCVACCEAIPAEATVCRYCGKKQIRSAWDLAGQWLKWIGGTTALISLIMGVVNLHGLVNTLRKKSAAVHELVLASQRMHEIEDMAGALRLVSRALELDPTDKSARNLQVSLALERLRRTGALTSEEKLEAIEPLIEIMQRGGGSEDPRVAADALAHFGWANYLRAEASDRNYSIDPYFQASLKLEPTNVFAHLLRGKWLLANDSLTENHDQLQAALEHFESARKSGRNSAYVDEQIWDSLARANVEGGQAALIGFCSEYRRSKKPMNLTQAHSALKVYYNRFHQHERFEDIVKRIPPSDLLATFEWLKEIAQEQSEKPEYYESFGFRFVAAKLHELCSEKQTAIREYRRLRIDMRKAEACDKTAYPFYKANRPLTKLLPIPLAGLPARLERLDGNTFQAQVGEKGTGYLVLQTDPPIESKLSPLKEGDIITHVNDTPVPRMISDFLVSVASVGRPGTTCEVTLFRDRQYRTETVRLSEMKPEEVDVFFKEHYDQFKRRRAVLDRFLYSTGYASLHEMGLSIAHLTPESRQDFGISKPLQGVLIVAIGERKSAHRMGFKPGDVIQRVLGHEITRSAELIEEINAAIQRKEIEIEIGLLREGKSLALNLRLPREPIRPM